MFLNAFVFLELNVIYVNIWSKNGLQKKEKTLMCTLLKKI